ncbi:hypothetical protein BKA67DRAFT_530093 [Truncatella angustata]|uniref:Uncharacterized protein n=1 Tax=Truncatella angustata TaxID=152316 RepID=A0A9P9A1V1_9PEZI|nr:uncharacterized protein BKA67DRAFT_530093 [Truncatella angustata]KAH6659971.1 hypothetical protein BKA67DRAFT_530093 [Truncatella angustata]
MNIARAPRTHRVVHCAESETVVDENREVKYCVKHSTLNPDFPFVVWANRGYEDELTKLYSDLPKEITNGFCESGIAYGRAVIRSGIIIETEGGSELPEYMWRATHSRQPFNGIKSRSRNGTNTVYVSIHFLMHYNWNCRKPSPFMSWTDERDKACRMAAYFEAKGYTGIEIHRVRT